MVYTNLLDVEFNYTQITNDFWILKFDTNENFYQYSYIDQIKKQLKTDSVVYVGGKKFYALISKNKFTNELDLQKYLEKIIDNDRNILWKKIDNLNFELNSNQQHTLNKRGLTQLLINTLAGIKNYNNITGRLYYVVDSKKISSLRGEICCYITLELKINYCEYKHSNRLCLLNNVKTFTNKKLLAKKLNIEILNKLVHYEINPKTRKIIRVQPGSSNDNIFINRSLNDKKKNDIVFLDFSSWSKFEKSKCGILYKFKNDIKNKLHKYFTKFEFVELAEGDKKLKFNKESSIITLEKIKRFYQTKTIVISKDTLTSPNDIAKADKLANKIKFILTNKNYIYKIPENNIKIDNTIQNDALNLRIIHNKKFYEKQNDPKNDFVGQGKLIQHITLEDFADYDYKNNNFIISMNKTSSPALDNLFKELYIKNDILNKKLTIIDWKLDNWKFIVREQINIDKNSSKYIFHLLEIAKGGVLLFKTFRSEKESEYRLFNDIYNKFNKNQEVEGLIISPDNNINIIIKTKLHTLPDFEKIGNYLKKAGQELNYPTKKIIELLKQFFSSEALSSKLKEKYKDDYNNLIKNLEKYKTEISKEEIRNKLKEFGFHGKTKFRKEFSLFFEQKLNDKLDTFFKDKNVRDDLFSSNLGIWWWKVDDKTAMYYVGKKTNNDLKQKINKAVILRKVIAYDTSDLIFEKLLHTMNVDFVKNKELTVLPYPFKYLREMKEI